MTQEPNIFPYIARLLQGAEVVWTTLGDEKKIEIANANRRPVKASERISGNIPYYGANNIQDYVEGYTHEGIYILIAEDGTKSIENYSVQWATGKFWANNHVHVLRGKNNVNSRFIYYYLQTVNFVPFLTGGDRAKLTKAKLLEIPIPLPPLSVQQEIVRILDKFTQLEAELEAELDCRLQQYEYYRNKLLAFNEIRQGTKVEWKTLGEVATFRRGSFPQPYTKSEWYGGDNSMPFVQVADMKDNRFNLVSITKQRISQLAMPKSIFVPKGTILVSLQGTIGRVAITQYDSYVDRTIAIFTHIDNEIDIRYFAYQLQLIFGIKKENARGSTIKTITKEEFSAFLIPLPPLEEQQRIVAILDKFDTLVNSISEGLPKEIALRRKQYEYYREKLLSFPKE